MGSSERRERIKKQVRADIIKTAKEIAREEGWQFVSIRKIADVIEYSAPILYEYFDSKDQLLEVIRMEGFQTLRDQYVHIKTLYRNPEKQLLEVAQTIWNFAKENPEVFQVMFNLEGAFCRTKNFYSREMDYKDNMVWDMIATLRPKSSEAVTKTYYEWWCATFGFVAITMATQVRGNIGDIEGIYMEGVRRFLRSVM